MAASSCVRDIFSAFNEPSAPISAEVTAALTGITDDTRGRATRYLLNGAGFFHQAQRAVDDCHALLEVLAFELPTTSAPALARLLETARKPTLRVWAEQTAFDSRTA